MTDDKKSKAKERSERIIRHNENAFEMRMLKSNTGLPVGIGMAMSYFIGFTMFILIQDPVRWYDIVWAVVLFALYVFSVYTIIGLVRSSLDVAESSGQMEGIRKCKQALEEATNDAEAKLAEAEAKKGKKA